MNTESGRLRFNIDGRWTATEMAASINSINFLYDLRLYLNHVEEMESYYEQMYDFFPIRHLRKRYGHTFALFGSPFLFRPDDIHQFSKIYFPNNPLTISRLQYASPGSKDFLGIGEILKQIREFVQFLILLPEEKEKRKLDNAALRIKNARDFVQLRLESRRADVQIDLIDNSGLAASVDEHTKHLIELIESGKITAVENVTDSPDEAA